MKALLLALCLVATPAYGLLIPTGNLVEDTSLGVTWVRVINQSIAVAPDDLPPNQRYATQDELNRLLGVYLIGDTPLEQLANARSLVRNLAFPSSLGDAIQAIYDVTESSSKLLRLIVGEDNTIFLDTQIASLPPIPDVGMLLIAESGTIPEPSTWLLMGTGLVFLLYCRKRSVA